MAPRAWTCQLHPGTCSLLTPASAPCCTQRGPSYQSRPARVRHSAAKPTDASGAHLSPTSTSFPGRSAVKCPDGQQMSSGQGHGEAARVPPHRGQRCQGHSRPPQPGTRTPETEQSTLPLPRPDPSSAPQEVGAQCRAAVAPSQAKGHPTLSCLHPPPRQRHQAGNPATSHCRTEAFHPKPLVPGQGPAAAAASRSPRAGRFPGVSAGRVWPATTGPCSPLGGRDPHRVTTSRCWPGIPPSVPSAAAPGSPSATGGAAHPGQPPGPPPRGHGGTGTGTRTPSRPQGTACPARGRAAYLGSRSRRVPSHQRRTWGGERRCRTRCRVPPGPAADRADPRAAGPSAPPQRGPAQAPARPLPATAHGTHAPPGSGAPTHPRGAGHPRGHRPARPGPPVPPHGDTRRPGSPARPRAGGGPGAPLQPAEGRPPGRARPRRAFAAGGPPLSLSLSPPPSFLPSFPPSPFPASPPRPFPPPPTLTGRPRCGPRAPAAIFPPPPDAPAAQAPPAAPPAAPHSPAPPRLDRRGLPAGDGRGRAFRSAHWLRRAWGGARGRGLE
ncbi:WAS/WASL-interacting protein family member 1-like [Haliaeetus albicilla]|uniref:WAS/WASL-interacting protein family member 1-like n=1 Tax=Haliaeetus albicilla TaxID=8969 RepID=UPI0037E8B2D5